MVREKYKKRIIPLNVFFMPCEDDKGNEWLEISLNGEGYPSIKKVEEMLRVLTKFLKHLKKLGPKEIDKINEKIEKDFEEEMMNFNKATGKRKREKENGYIYILKSKNLYKIGRAKSLKSRIKTYRTENPFGIRVILQKEVDDYIGIEDRLLRKFKNKQVRGEWFKLNKEDIKWLKQNI